MNAAMAVQPRKLPKIGKLIARFLTNPLWPARALEERAQEFGHRDDAWLEWFLLYAALASILIRLARLLSFWSACFSS